MSTTNYYSIHGQIIGEKTAGSSRVDYLTDALGSVTATVDQSAAVVNTYRYKPYGGLLAKTGGGSDPAFQWVGSQGYRQTGKAYSDIYVRARHYSSAQGRWTTEDPRGYLSELNRYRYGANRPTILIDRSGKAVSIIIAQEAQERPHTRCWPGGADFFVRFSVYGPTPNKLGNCGEKARAAQTPGEG